MIPSVQRKYKLKLEFIAYGLIEGTLFDLLPWNKRKVGCIIENGTTSHRENVVYGALFYCKNFEFDSAILDAFHDCKYSILGMNHPKDRTHRKEVEVAVIHFDTLNDLAYLRYKEVTKIKAIAYFGNPNHPKINHKVFKRNVYRLQDGIFPQQFRDLFMEVSKDAKHNFNES